MSSVDVQALFGPGHRCISYIARIERIGIAGLIRSVLPTYMELSQPTFENKRLDIRVYDTLQYFYVIARGLTCKADLVEDR